MVITNHPNRIVSQTIIARRRTYRALRTPSGPRRTHRGRARWSDETREMSNSRVLWRIKGPPQDRCHVMRLADYYYWIGAPHYQWTPVRPMTRRWFLLQDRLRFRALKYNIERIEFQFDAHLISLCLIFISGTFRYLCLSIQHFQRC